MTNLQVEELCKCLEDGMRNKEVAEMFGVDPTVVSHIRRGSIWKSISVKYDLEVKRSKRKSIELIKLICEKIVEGCKDKEISEALFIDVREVNRVRLKTTHKVISDNYF